MGQDVRARFLLGRDDILGLGLAKCVLELLDLGGESPSLLGLLVVRRPIGVGLPVALGILVNVGQRLLAEAPQGFLVCGKSVRERGRPCQPVLHGANPVGKRRPQLLRFGLDLGQAFDVGQPEDFGQTLLRDSFLLSGEPSHPFGDLSLLVRACALLLRQPLLLFRGLSFASFTPTRLLRLTKQRSHRGDPGEQECDGHGSDDDRARTGGDSDGGPDEHDHYRDPERSVALRELRQSIHQTRRSGDHGLVVEMALEVRRHGGRALVATGGVLLERLHRDPVEVTTEAPPQRANIAGAVVGGRLRVEAERREARGGLGWLDLTDDALHLGVPRLAQHSPVEGKRTDEQLVQHDPEGVHVGSRVDVEGVRGRLFGAHVLGSAEDLSELGVQSPLGQARSGGLRNPEIDDLRHRPTVLPHHEDVRWLQVPVNHAFLVGVLYAVADGKEQLETRAGAQAVSVAVGRERNSRDEFHHVVGTSFGGGAVVEHTGDIGVVHDG